jgi:Fe-S-cluster containining protein
MIARPLNQRVFSHNPRLDPEGFASIYGVRTEKDWLLLKSRRGADGKAEDACVFLDQENKCSIYEAR